MKTKGYWKDRPHRKAIFRRLKRYSLFQKMFSVRAGDDAFLYQMQADIATTSILDVACGSGKISLVDISNSCTGIDIKGYPSENAITLGYKETFVWGEGFGIPTRKKFDLITLINLNAHIEFDVMSLILNALKSVCHKDTKIIFINEYNNDSYLFLKMKKNKKQFDAYVKKCEHHNFHYQNDFLNFMSKKNWLKLNKTKVTSENPPLMHFLAVKSIDSNKFIWRSVSLFADFFISQINNINKPKSGFIVAHVFSIENH